MIAEGILPWQALKVYARVPSYSISDKGLFDYATGKYTAPRFENYVTGEVTTTVPSSDVVVHEGTTDPILSDSPFRPTKAPLDTDDLCSSPASASACRSPRSAADVRVPPAGAFDIAYHLYGSALCSSPTHINPCHPERSAQREVEGSAVPPAAALAPKPSNPKAESASFFDGIDTSIEGIARPRPSVCKREHEGRFSQIEWRHRALSVARNTARSDLNSKSILNSAANWLQLSLKLSEMTIKNLESLQARSNDASSGPERERLSTNSASSVSNSTTH